MYDTLLILTALLTTVNAGITPNACDMPGKFTKGATVRYFNYSLADTESVNDINFLLGGYLKNKYEGTVTGVMNLQWDSGWPAINPPYGFTGVPIENFLMEITSYYYAPQTGIYTKLMILLLFSWVQVVPLTVVVNIKILKPLNSSLPMLVMH